jgi:uncharacterized protein with NRDE domain
MCLILIAWHGRKDYPCLVAANRDEFHTRPAAQAAWWNEGRILAGKDLLAGGTWLGITRAGRFAALTNFRGAARREDAPSRGSLVTEILCSSESALQTLETLREVGPRYAGFNVIFSDGERLAVYESTTGSGRILGAGIYGLSNHLLDTPWPKVENAKSALSTALHELPATGAVLDLLRDEKAAADADLPRTGVSLDWERLLSSAFIRAEQYGTRCSTVLSINGAQGVSFDEWTWNVAGEYAGHMHESFTIAAAPSPQHAST